MKINALVFTAVLAALCSSSAMATPLVVNGGFETGNFSGWTLSTHTGNPYVDGAVRNTGRFSAHLGYNGGLSDLYQSVTTNTSDTYSLQFYLFVNSSAGPNEFVVKWDGATLFDSVNMSSTGGFVHYQFDGLTASSASTVLDFTHRHDPDHFFLDDVSLTVSQATVPEPGSLALISLAVAGMGALRRRRQVR